MLTLHHMLAFILISLSLFFVGNSHATVIYTWVDENGISHYSQEPPVGVEAARLYSEDIEPNKVGYIAPKKEVPVPSEEAQEQADAKLIKEKDSKQADAICQNATHSLNILTSHSNLNRKNEQTGEVETMTEPQRQAAIAENQQRIKLFCNDAKSN